MHLTSDTMVTVAKIIFKYLYTNHTISYASPLRTLERA